MDKTCPRCYVNAQFDAGKGVAVRDCLSYCSNCGATIESIDYVHTCLGGNLCSSCWKTMKGESDVPRL